MSGGGRDVSQIWEQLKSQQAPARRSGPTLSGLAGLPGITTHVRTYDKSRGPRQQEQRPSFFAQLGNDGGREQQQQQGAPPDCQALLASLQRDINSLSDPDRSTRRRAVEKLHAALLGAGAGVSAEALQAVLAGPLLVPLVRLLADPAEKCRELGTAFLAAALPRLAAPNALLPTLVPALAERVGSSSPQESSEEMRLALAELLAGPLLGTLAAAPAGGPAVMPPELLPPLCATLWCQLADPYSDIKKAACTGITHLAGLLGPSPDALPTALLEPLVGALATALTHQHSRVRLAALHALHALVRRGMPLAVVQEGVLPAVRPLAEDHTPAIRAALFSHASQWAGSQLLENERSSDGGDDGRAANQCRALLPLLLPLLLLGLTDEAETVRSDTYARLEAVGAFLGKQIRPGSAEEAMGCDPSAQQLPGYCHPFNGARPSAATRGLVQAQLPRLLQQGLAELREWTASQRMCAARFLRACLVYGEDEVLPLLPTVLLGLQGAVADDDAGVATHAVGCVHVLGCNIPPRQWMPLACEAAAAEQQSVAQRTAALAVLSALLYAAFKSQAEVEADPVRLAAATMSSPSLAAAALAPDGSPLRHQLLVACSNLVRWAGPGVAAAAPRLFQLLLQLWTAEADSGAAAGPVESAPPASAALAAAAAAAAGPTRASEVLAQLAAALGQDSASDLCQQYGRDMLRSCTQDHEQWTHTHPGWRTTSALLHLADSTALVQLWPLALSALQQIAADHERDPRLRLELLHLVAVLVEDDGKAEAWPNAAVGQQLVSFVLSPALVWRAGRVPAAARYAALAALASLLGKQRLPAEQVAAAASAGPATVNPGTEALEAGSATMEGSSGLPPTSLFARVAGCLDEEYEPDTRHMACHAVTLLLEHAGKHLAPAQLAALQRDLLARLDDSSIRVRVSACAALSAWLACLLAPPAPGAAPGLSDVDAAALASSMLIHADDPDADMAEAVCGTLCTLATARPGVVHPLAQAAATSAGQRTRPDLLDRVLAACTGKGGLV